MAKVLISAGMIQGGRGGVGRHVIELVKALHRGGAGEGEVFVAGSDSDRKLFPDVDDDHWVAIPKWAGRAVANLLWHQLRLPGVVKRLGIDVVHIPSYRRVLWRCPCRQVVTVHDCAPFVMRERYDLLRGFFGRKVVPPLIRRCDVVVAVSASTAEDLVQYMGIERSKLHVVPNGIDHRLYFPRPAEAVREFMAGRGQVAPYFFYVGRLEHPGKNHCRLIEAYEAFRDESGLEIDLVLAGADWNGAEVVHERIDASPYVDDIRRLGFVDDDDLPFWYCGARAVLLPSLSEGFGIPIAEAFACGVPVVASHLPPLKEVGADEAEYVDPLDAASIRDGLTRISRGGDEGGGARRERARGFDWDEVAEQIRRIYGLGELEIL